MDPDLSALDAHLDSRGVDGYLLHAASDDADQYYLSGFDAPDPFLTLYDGEVRLLFARSLEYGRAKAESRAATVERYVDFGHEQLSEEHGRHEATDRALARFLDAHGVESVTTPPQFPLRTADGLREQGVSVSADRESALAGVRAVKTAQEVDHVRATQRANEAAMARAEELLAGASVDDEGRLVHGGEVLTSERVREEIEATLLREGCALNETIVACGRDAADPHDRGGGPLLTDRPIIVDIFPQSKAHNYHSDMTRTFVRGEPDETVREWYELTAAAKTAALDAIEPGTTGEAVHGAACEVYENAGLPTLRADERTETGFIHSTGHGVGLEIHERPRLSPGGDELEPGHVVTVEPGLYDPEVGGVRIEDIVVVTEDDYENLVDYPERLSAGQR